jgi:hypothetical protein
MAYTGARQRDEDASAGGRVRVARQATPADSVLRLQQAAGNRALGRLVRQVARRTLDDEAKDARPRGLKVNTVFTKFQADYKPFEGTTISDDINVIFGSGIKDDRAFRGGLQSIAMDNLTAMEKDKPKLVSLDDEVQEIYIDFGQDFPADDDAKTFATENGLWRFTYVKLSKPPKGSKATHDLLIEQVSKGPRASSTPGSADVRKRREDRFTALGFTFTASGVASAEATQDPKIAADEKKYTERLRAGVEDDKKALASAKGAQAAALQKQIDKHQKELDDRTPRTTAFSPAEKDVVLRAVELTDDAFAKKLAGLTFARIGRGAPSNEAADYSSDRHAIRCFDDAFRQGPVWYANGSENVRGVLHEIGHAIDYAQRRAAHGLSIDAADDNSRKAAEDAEKSAHLLSGGDDANSAYQAAVKADGGAITAYGETKRPDGPVEDYGDAYSLYTADPDLLKSLRPHVFAYFETLRKKGP